MPHAAVPSSADTAITIGAGRYSGATGGRGGAVMEAENGALERLADDPRFRELVRRRDRFAGLLSASVLLAYFGFILLVAFAKPLLARPLAGGAMSVGIPIGLGVILFAIASTGVYVRRANREFDGEMERIVRDFRA